MRERYIQGADGQLYTPSAFAEKYPQRSAASPNLAFPMIIGDMQPYREVATGDSLEIGGRAQHREFLKRHNLRELAPDEKPAPVGQPVATSAAPELYAAWDALTH